MCEKCNELDKKIAHLRDLAARVLDPQTIQGAHRLIEEMQAQKAAFHSEQQK